ncbi:hypothetical protein QTP86_000551 [Hemibagrus guttatus]|nr:hypothetical protein QTP86_000551 [Hemibagrus guttatus]
MRKSGVAEKYVRVVQDMYERSRTVVRCAVGQTEEFKVEVGLHQGSALSPFLFAMVMDQLSEEVRLESPWTMMIADDIVICSDSREQVEENLERWRFALERRGMKVSHSKTEYMCVNEREGSGTIRLQGEEVKKVQVFKYMGSAAKSNGECGKEVKKRVQAAAAPGTQPISVSVDLQFPNQQTTGSKDGQTCLSLPHPQHWSPQGCVLSPLLYSLYMYYCVATTNSTTIIKFADDTVVVELISDNNEMAYLEEIRNLENWCQRNNLLLNISKTKELIVDFCTKQERNYQTPMINASPVERVDSFRYLSVHTTQDLSWSCHINTVVKKARQRLYHLRCLKDFRLPSKVLRKFYSCTIESILTGNITTWFGNSTMQTDKLFRGWCDQLNASSIPSSLTCIQFTASGAGPRPGRS